jgi:hypothetical protein
MCLLSHRRYTRNHALSLDWWGDRLFVKISPNRAEAAREIGGHDVLRGLYPVPTLRWHAALGRYAVIAYDRVGTDARDEGLLLDEINAADETGQMSGLDRVLDAVIGHYATVMRETCRLAPQVETVSKLYGDRVLNGGRLDAYYGSRRPILRLPEGEALRADDLRRMTLIVNGREHRVDFDELLAWLRRVFAPRRHVWAAVTQGDPTDLNIGTAPVWFDYDTAGLNALAGEFACFLWYQRLHGGWLVPTYNAAAFVDHPKAISGRRRNRPVVHVCRDGRHGVRIDYRHDPSPARRHVISRYRDELIQPVAEHLGITDMLDWLRPYVVLRILGVYDVGTLATTDGALSLAYLAETLSAEARLDHLLGSSSGPGGREADPWANRT